MLRVIGKMTFPHGTRTLISPYESFTDLYSFWLLPILQLQVVCEAFDLFGRWNFRTLLSH